MNHQTVIAAYQNSQDAQAAVNALAQAGISRADIHMHPSNEASLSSDINTTTAVEHSNNPLVHFFRRVLGLDEEHRLEHEIYAEAVRRGHFVVAVEAASLEEVDHVTAILNQYNHVDIEERAAHWRNQGWTGYDHGAPRMTEEDIMRDRAAYPASAAGARPQVYAGTRPSVSDAPAAYAGTRPSVESQALDSGSVGNAGGSGITSTDDAGVHGMTADLNDEAEFRRHWQSAYSSTGGRYEDYDAAYRYGTTMGMDSRYASYQWSEVEPQARSDWESTHPGSTWDKVKDAVRYAAERVTHQHHHRH
ncbi:hypothetical protein SAMN06265795_11918 [Noviherbaspirillum humi]|uniref:Heat induced stress protein YflT n=1 Tax=Noviherbaspirillum humi TaxID=1688639 RepID=A0A239L4Z6_9BURK|nr:hypothetical protein [Noviherbaspirillum humi]SNT24759.1 hypothetical protein SAMN06265795_11918 [Noviherbaspirillum humi]